MIRALAVVVAALSSLMGFADGDKVLTTPVWIDYTGGVWVWGDVPVSYPGQCPSEDSCVIRWDKETGLPVVLPVIP